MYEEEERRRRKRRRRLGTEHHLKLTGVSTQADYFDSNNSLAIGNVFVSPATTFCSMTGKLSVSYHQMFLANGLRAKAVSVEEEKLPWL